MKVEPTRHGTRMEEAMNAATIVTEWRRTVATQLFPRLHGHQAKALADFSYAAALGGSCQAGLLASHVPGPAKPASARRRAERLLSNGRLRPRLAQRQLARELLRAWAGRTVLLLLDETPRANDLRALGIRVAYRHRALPLAAVCYRHKPEEPARDTLSPGVETPPPAPSPLRLSARQFWGRGRRKRRS